MTSAFHGRPVVQAAVCPQNVSMHQQGHLRNVHRTCWFWWLSSVDAKSLMCCLSYPIFVTMGYFVGHELASVAGGFGLMTRL